MLPQLNTEYNLRAEQPEPATEDNLTKETVSEPATAEPEDMSMAAPLAISQPIREWVATKRENIRPISTFFNTANFHVGSVSCNSLVNYQS